MEILLVYIPCMIGWFVILGMSYEAIRRSYKKRAIEKGYDLPRE